jgi:hypothetical protein
MRDYLDADGLWKRFISIKASLMVFGEMPGAAFLWSKARGGVEAGVSPEDDDCVVV